MPRSRGPLAQTSLSSITRMSCATDTHLYFFSCHWTWKQSAPRRKQQHQHNKTREELIRAHICVPMYVCACVLECNASRHCGMGHCAIRSSAPPLGVRFDSDVHVRAPVRVRWVTLVPALNKRRDRLLRPRARNQAWVTHTYKIFELSSPKSGGFSTQPRGWSQN